MTLLILLPEAEQELLEAIQRYDDVREGLGDEFLGKVDLTLERIRRGPRQSPVAFRTARIALVDRFPYIVVYEFADERIRVV
ncbi:hypothetical protein, partial [Proteus faecis]|uniref:hypothetical protein n=1 Tax=Proteus faecis TaxID=2050967 RepID=UPI003075C69A